MCRKITKKDLVAEFAGYSLLLESFDRSLKTGKYHYINIFGVKETKKSLTFKARDSYNRRRLRLLEILSKLENQINNY